MSEQSSAAAPPSWLTTACQFVQAGGELQSALYAVAPLDKLSPAQLTGAELAELIRAHAKARVLAATELRRENPREWLTAANLEQGLSFFGPFLQQQAEMAGVIDTGAARFNQLLCALEKYLQAPKLIAELRLLLDSKTEEVISDAEIEE